MPQTAIVLFDLALIIVAARLLGALARRVGQPPVIGELATGILLGPMILGSHLTGVLFPSDVRPLLSTLGTFGLALFMFTVGLDLGHRRERPHAKAASAISLVSVALPFGLGVALAAFIATGHAAENKLAFALFLGTAMSVTAFPVLARIITDHNLQHTAIGKMAMTCAAVDDVCAWSLLTVVTIVAGTKQPAHSMMIVLAIPFLLLIALAFRPALRKLLGGRAATPAMTCTLLACALCSAAFTEWIGLHFIFGAFILGAAIPTLGFEGQREALNRWTGPITAVLLPVFFTISGLKVDLGTLGPNGFVELVLIILVAVVGKFGGAWATARLAKISPRDSITLAALVNTRGLTELIVLSVGLELAIIDQAIYSIMVVMALVTTAMAGPVLRLLHRTGAHKKELLLSGVGTVDKNQN
ncbi:cation:proton antiporter [Lentzea aerocolonigenes]|uniref:cation:proton antiporter n=1 Tax=Lentzea aerocolonigenes TaxID=68170 RepID=UPI0005EBF87C|nr:cation:proton antiporter [Lentzea aerocolonigenes]